MGLLDVIESEINQSINTESHTGTTAVTARTPLAELVAGIESGFPAGQRNAGLTSLAGLLRSRGLTGEIIGALLAVVNRSSPQPLPDLEAQTIARSVSRYSPRLENRIADPQAVMTIADAAQKWHTQRANGGCKFGYPLLDAGLPSFNLADVLVIMGRSGTGKTNLALQLGGSVAQWLGGYQLFVSLEMDASSVYLRAAQIALSEQAGHGLNTDAVLSEIDNRPMPAVIQKRFSNLLIVDKDSLTIDQIEQYLQFATEKVQPAPVPVVTIDYLGYLTSTTPGTNYDRVSSLAKAVKGFSKRNQIRTILLCQTSRAGEDGCKPVELHHARDSGAIEESADHVLGLWTARSEPRLHVEVLKTRFAARGTRLDFINQGMHLIEQPYQADPVQTPERAFRF